MLGNTHLTYIHLTNFGSILWIFDFRFLTIEDLLQANVRNAQSAPFETWEHYPGC